MSDPKLPFEPKNSKYSAAYSGLNSNEILAEVDRLPVEIRNKTRDIVLQGLYRPEVDHALDHKLDDIAKLSPTEISAHLAKIVPAGVYERSKYFDSLPMEQVLRVTSLEKLGKVDVVEDVYSRHTVGGKKFISELFKVKDNAAAQKEFPEVPVTRRREWYDKSITMVLSDLVSPHIERFKRCLNGPHRIDNKLLGTYPCETASISLNHAMESGKKSMGRIGNCYSQRKAYHRFMIEQPDYQVASRAFTDLQICMNGEQAYTEVRAGLLAEHHKATIDDITGTPQQKEHH